VRLLLDTAALIFAVESPDRLRRHIQSILRDPQNLLELSVISIIEIAIKSSRGKLSFSERTLQQAIDDLDLRILPFTAQHAFHLFDLPAHHRDPFDRQIIAQALCERIPVITSDEKFGLYKGLKVIW
jgi:PIN domain nuclease of toxin-antitoxin system